jgi:hypothetical protein
LAPGQTIEVEALNPAMVDMPLPPEMPAADAAASLLGFFSPMDGGRGQSNEAITTNSANNATPEIEQGGAVEAVTDDDGVLMSVEALDDADFTDNRVSSTAVSHLI